MLPKTIIEENRYMVLGGIECPENIKSEIFNRIKEIKENNGIKYSTELKWTKVSKGKVEAYKDIINYFFDKDGLKFRAVVVDKSKLKEGEDKKSFNELYYKIYYQLLNWFLDDSHLYNIYIDIKDTQGVEKIDKLKDVLRNKLYDFDGNCLKKIQQIRSHEVATMQMVDIIIGAVSYANRYGDKGKSDAKNELVDLIRSKSGLSLVKSSTQGAKKFNIFCWEGKR